MGQSDKLRHAKTQRATRKGQHTKCCCSGAVTAVAAAVDAVAAASLVASCLILAKIGFLFKVGQATRPSLLVSELLLLARGGFSRFSVSLSLSLLLERQHKAILIDRKKKEEATAATTTRRRRERFLIFLCVPVCVCRCCRECSQPVTGTCNGEQQINSYKWQHLRLRRAWRMWRLGSCTICPSQSCVKQIVCFSRLSKRGGFTRTSKQTSTVTCRTLKSSTRLRCRSFRTVRSCEASRISVTSYSPISVSTRAWCPSTAALCSTQK